MSLPLAARGVTALAAQLRDGQLDPMDLVDDALAVIARRDPQLHAFLAVTEDRARADAVRAREALRRDDAGLLTGIPIGIKDLFDVAGVATTHGSLVHRDDVAAADGGVVARVAAAGAVVVGKTNTSEFGQSVTTENRLGPPTATPWEPTRTAGGSSGGSAAAVAVGACPVAVGSDAGGSIRVPAAYCGVVGLKPTHGTSVAEGGPTAMSAFGDVGPLAAHVEDLRLLAEVLLGRELPRTHPSGLRVGICGSMEGRPVDPGVAAGVDRAAGLLEAAGHRVQPVELNVTGWQELFSTLVLADERRVHGHLLAEAASLTDYERVTLEAAARLDATQVARARAELPVFRRRVTSAVAQVDVICTPATAALPFPHGRRPREIAGWPVDGLWGAFPFTAPINVAGLPAVAVPVATVGGLPVAVQLVGSAGSEAGLLALAGQLHEAGEVDAAVCMGDALG